MIPDWKQEALIEYYQQILWQYCFGDLTEKVTYLVKWKAESLGFSQASAFRIIRYAKEMGIIEQIH